MKELNRLPVLIDAWQQAKILDDKMKQKSHMNTPDRPKCGKSSHVEIKARHGNESHAELQTLGFS